MKRIPQTPTAAYFWPTRPGYPSIVDEQSQRRHDDRLARAYWRPRRAKRHFRIDYACGAALGVGTAVGVWCFAFATAACIAGDYRGSEHAIVAIPIAFASALYTLFSAISVTQLVWVLMRASRIRSRATSVACFAGGMAGLPSCLLLMAGVRYGFPPDEWIVFLCILVVLTFAAQLGAGRHTLRLRFSPLYAAGFAKHRRPARSRTRFTIRQALLAMTIASVALALLRVLGLLRATPVAVLSTWLVMQAITCRVAVWFVDWRWRVKISHANARWKEAQNTRRRATHEEPTLEHAR